MTIDSTENEWMRCCRQMPKICALSTACCVSTIECERVSMWYITWVQCSDHRNIWTERNKQSNAIQYNVIAHSAQSRSILRTRQCWDWIMAWKGNLMQQPTASIVWDYYLCSQFGDTTITVSCLLRMIGARSEFDEKRSIQIELEQFDSSVTLTRRNELDLLKINSKESRLLPGSRFGMEKSCKQRIPCCAIELFRVWGIFNQIRTCIPYVLIAREILLLLSLWWDYFEQCRNRLLAEIANAHSSRTPSPTPTHNTIACERERGSGWIWWRRYAPNENIYF